MKRILLLLFIPALFSTCNNNQGSPTAAIDGMFAEMKSGNIDGMKKFITRSDISMIETGEKILNSIDPEAIQKIKTKMADEFKEKLKTVTYKLKNENINGDNATIDAEIIENLPAGKPGEKKTIHTFELVKEDNTWKIALTKPGNSMFNSMKGNMGAEKQDLQDGLERLKNMNPDSLKMLLHKGMQAMDSLDKMKDKN